MGDLLFEIGTEELPADFVASGERQLRAATERLLDDLRLIADSVATFATPRRLAVLVRGLPEAQAGTVSERRGPPVARAYNDDGSFSAAAVGFARANDIAAEELVRRETETGEYLFAVKDEPGAATSDVLAASLGRLVDALSFPKTMRWDASGSRFPRPIRWLVTVLDSDVLPVRHGDLEADRQSRGHRLLHPGPVEIPSATEYADVLQEAGVIADREERREAVAVAAEQAARQLGGRPILHAAVWDEVCDLVERPVALAGRFDPSYLEVPRDVLVTAMESHQRYFAVEDEEGELVAGFVCISNAAAENAEIVIRGNERVLRARLEDARFFYGEDVKVPLSARTEQLAEIVLHARLGTMRDKVVRTGALLGKIAGWLDLSEADADSAYLAAEVHKADLLTHLVYEFPELQGVVGREYAMRDPELQERAGDLLPAVAVAVWEHYLPRFAGDDLPSSPAGVALCLADRLDTLVGYIGVGEIPTGSEDPFGLRRHATAFAQVSLSANARIPLEEAVAAGHELYARAGVELSGVGEVVREVRGLIGARAEAMLEREGISPLFVAAARDAQWHDLPDLAERARALQALHAEGRLHRLAVVHERAYNLSRGAEDTEVEEAAFEHPAEGGLYAKLVEAEEAGAARAATGDYAGTLELLVPLAEEIGVFFDEVLVMASEERLRRNRLALLKRTASLFALVADFSGIEPKLLQEP